MLRKRTTLKEKICKVVVGAAKTSFMFVAFAARRLAENTAILVEQLVSVGINKVGEFVREKINDFVENHEVDEYYTTPFAPDDPFRPKF